MDYWINIINQWNVLFLQSSMRYSRGERRKREREKGEVSKEGDGGSGDDNIIWQY